MSAKKRFNPRLRKNRVLPLALIDKIKAWAALEQPQRQLTLEQDFEAAAQVIADRRKLAFEICQSLNQRFGDGEDRVATVRGSVPFSGH